MAKSYWDLDDDERDKADIDLQKLNVERTLLTKSERAVTKGIITSEEQQKLDKAINKAIRKNNYDWWADKKGQKSFEVMQKLMQYMELPEVEILNKIEKA